MAPPAQAPMKAPSWWPRKASASIRMRPPQMSTTVGVRQPVLRIKRASPGLGAALVQRAGHRAAGMAAGCRALVQRAQAGSSAPRTSGLEFMPAGAAGVFVDWHGVILAAKANSLQPRLDARRLTPGLLYTRVELGGE